MVIVHNTQCRGNVGGRSTQNTRIDRFWREHNVNVMIHFRDKFRRLEALGHLESDDNTDLWSLCCVFMDVID